MSESSARSPIPIATAHLFPVLEAKLIELLQSLTPADWQRQTLAPRWKVKDVATHLLDTELRMLSRARDGFVAEETPIRSAADLLELINRLNAEGVAFLGRLSPAMLIALMREASRQLCDYVASLDPHAPAPFGVSWAGEEHSANWFHIAREYTERWHHQQQIRAAVSKPGIMSRELYFPVLDSFMRALPVTYGEITAPEGAAVQFHVAGEAGGSWQLVRLRDAWQLRTGTAPTKAAEVTIPQEIAWRIFTKGITREEAAAQVRVIGDAGLGRQILSAIAIIG